MSTENELAGSYDVDENGFLKDWTRWDERFPERMASSAGISDGLTEEHWRVLSFIRDEFERTGECAPVYVTCRATGLSRRDLRALFPAGYMRGACKLAGITYRDRFVEFPEGSEPETDGSKDGAAVTTSPPSSGNGLPPTDEFGFLLDPADWDEEYAARMAWRMKMPGGLTDEHMRVIHYLRERYAAAGVVPTVIECCEDCGLELEDLERLFPDGYQRGAVKIAGLRVG
jgi:tRNA 2-thiouridine synthesizing protein E